MKICVGFVTSQTQNLKKNQPEENQKPVEMVPGREGSDGILLTLYSSLIFGSNSTSLPVHI